MTRPQNGTSRHDAAHIAWVDYAKGLTIVLVVMLYANEKTHNPADAQGWLDYVVSFARPFRMPDFFLVSGMLLPLAIHRGWRTYLDRKVVHFAYFYVLWLTILVAFESPWIAAKAGWSGVAALYVKSFWHPYSLLWFIYLLPLFFLTTKLLARAPAALVWLAAAALQLAGLQSGIKVLDKFATYYVFFYSGYVLAPYVFKLADAVSARPARGLAALGLWGVLDAYLVFAGYAALPGVGLALGLLGAAAVVACSALLSTRRWATPLAYCGRNSIVIYLAFLIPLVVTRKALIYTGWITDAGWIALLGTFGGVAGALAMHRLVKDTRLAFLFERPARFWLAPVSARYKRRQHRVTPQGASESP